MGNSPLISEIRERIAATGPITFAVFMQMALYHPIHGFYARPDRGPGHDYRTSPALTPEFGRLIARALERMWHELGEPPQFTVLEVGGGRGELALSCIESAPSGLRESLAWEFVEPFESMRGVQADLPGDEERVAWRTELADGESVTGCVLANEVLDNFPVHLFEIAGGEPLEVYLDVEGEHLTEILGPPSPEAGELPSPAEAGLGDGDRFEVCVALPEWSREVYSALERGYLLLIDYGDVEPGIWARRPTGTLVTYRDQQIDTNLLESPGETDITAHVNFTRLIQALETAGFASVMLETQREFLKGLGIDEARDQLRAAQAEAESSGRNGEALQLLAERGRLGALIARGGLGDFRVLKAVKAGAGRD